MDSDELGERFLEFALQIGFIVRALGNDTISVQVATQLAKSGTSPGPNYQEACACESRKDFIHKLSIVLKELRESRFWLRYILRLDLLAHVQVAPVVDECEQLNRIIGKSIVTAKRNAR